MEEDGRKCRFDDFSIANVFYSSAAAMNGNSLRLAGKDMAAVLGIKDNVHLISDVNLYLEAKTESGHIIADEERLSNGTILTIKLNRSCCLKMERSMSRQLMKKPI